MTLKETRRLTGLTRKALAAAAGCSGADIADLERGKNRNPSHSLVTGIVQAFQKRGLAGLTSQDIFPVGEQAPPPEAPQNEDRADSERRERERRAS